MWIYTILNDNQAGIEVKVSDDGTYEWMKNQIEGLSISDSDSQSLKDDLKRINIKK
jgi:hypothetical protein